MYNIFLSFLFISIRSWYQYPIQNLLLALYCNPFPFLEILTAFIPGDFGRYYLCSWVLLLWYNSFLNYFLIIFDQLLNIIIKFNWLIHIVIAIDSLSYGLHLYPFRHTNHSLWKVYFIISNLYRFNLGLNYFFKIAIIIIIVFIMLRCLSILASCNTNRSRDNLWGCLVVVFDAYWVIFSRLPCGCGHILARRDN